MWSLWSCPTVHISRKRGSLESKIRNLCIDEGERRIKRERGRGRSQERECIVSNTDWSSHKMVRGWLDARRLEVVIKKMNNESSPSLCMKISKKRVIKRRVTGCVQKMGWMIAIWDDDHWMNEYLAQGCWTTSRRHVIFVYKTSHQPLFPLNICVSSAKPLMGVGVVSCNFSFSNFNFSNYNFSNCNFSNCNFSNSQNFKIALRAHHSIIQYGLPPVQHHTTAPINLFRDYHEQLGCWRTKISSNWRYEYRRENYWGGGMRPVVHGEHKDYWPSPHYIIHYIALSPIYIYNITTHITHRFRLIPLEYLPEEPALHFNREVTLAELQFQYLTMKNRNPKSSFKVSPHSLLLFPSLLLSSLQHSLIIQQCVRWRICTMTRGKPTVIMYFPVLFHLFLKFVFILLTPNAVFKLWTLWAE